MLGRALGVVYGVPLLYFGLRGRIPAHIRGKVAGLFALGGGQGLVGWWMVKSGLEVCPSSYIADALSVAQMHGSFQVTRFGGTLSLGGARSLLFATFVHYVKHVFTW